jgi:hypothetical protein
VHVTTITVNRKECIMKRTAIMLFSVFLLASLASTAGAMTYDVEIVDQIPGGTATGQPFSPPVAIVHDNTYHLVTIGQVASPGLVQVAESGNPSLLQTEASGSAGVMSVVVGTGPYFDMQTIQVNANPGDLLTVVWMLGRTNDCFSGIHDVALPAADSLQFVTDVWDAGSEVNTGMTSDIPFYGGMGHTDENGTIQMISSYSVVDDPTFGMITWNFPPSGLLTIREAVSSATEATTWGAIKKIYD